MQIKLTERVISDEGLIKCFRPVNKLIIQAQLMIL